MVSPAHSYPSLFRVGGLLQLSLVLRSQKKVEFRRELAKLASAQEGLRLPFPLARHRGCLAEV
jgi:hypothetical protein